MWLLVAKEKKFPRDVAVLVLRELDVCSEPKKMSKLLLDHLHFTIKHIRDRHVDVGMLGAFYQILFHTMKSLFEKERSKQRTLIKLDETRIIMERSAQSLLKRGQDLNKTEEVSVGLVEHSRRLYWASIPWYKRWLYCCFA